jgi:hypothetical protein
MRTGLLSAPEGYRPATASRPMSTLKDVSLPARFRTQRPRKRAPVFSAAGLSSSQWCDPRRVLSSKALRGPLNLPRRHEFTGIMLRGPNRLPLAPSGLGLKGYWKETAFKPQNERPFGPARFRAIRSFRQPDSRRADQKSGSLPGDQPRG